MSEAKSTEKLPDREWTKEIRSIKLYEFGGTLEETISQIKDAARGLRNVLITVESEEYDGYQTLEVSGFRKRTTTEIKWWDEAEAKRQANAEKRRLRALAKQPDQLKKKQEKDRKEDLALLKKIAKRNPDLIQSFGTDITVKNSIL
jgi:aspartokinase